MYSFRPQLDSRMSQKVDALMAGGGKKKRKHGGGDVGQFTAQRKVVSGANQMTCTAALHGTLQFNLLSSYFIYGSHLINRVSFFLFHDKCVHHVV